MPYFKHIFEGLFPYDCFDIKLSQILLKISKMLDMLFIDEVYLNHFVYELHFNLDKNEHH